MTPLEQLVMVLDRDHGGRDTAEWVQAIGSVGHHELVRDRYLEHLLGFTAPQHCSAIAMTAPGWARSTDLPSPLARARQQRVRISCAVARNGDVVGRIRWADGSQVDEPPQSGRSLDILRRCLGLPTDPPALPSGCLLAAQWLEAISRMARRSARPPDWDRVAGQHPAMQVARHGGLPVGADDLVQVAGEAARIWSWSELLRQAGEPGPLAEALPSGLGRWMDEGMLSRWLLAAYPPLAEQLAEVLALVTPTTGRRIEQALGALALTAVPPAVDRSAPCAYWTSIAST